MGGWTNPYIVNWFVNYARVAFELFGDRVKYWITMNEPREVCFQGYGTVTKAARFDIGGMAEYMCSKNLLLAHAKAYRIYDEEYRVKQGGNIFITVSAQFYIPESENDVIAAEDANQFEWATYSHPIFSETGDFPPVLKEMMAARSADQGFPRLRLPDFPPAEIEYVKGSSNYFGLSHYSTFIVYRNESVLHKSPSYYDDLQVVVYQSHEWEHGASRFMKVVTWGFYELLTKTRKDYNNPPVYITENGYSSYGGLVDDDRISCIRQYISAMDEGSDVRAYTVWSIMDNFEWMQGYTTTSNTIIRVIIKLHEMDRFVIYEVNFKSPERTRTPRKSAFVYKEILRTRSLGWNYEPNATVRTIDEEHESLDQ